VSLTTIEWTDATWNPTRGCVKVSPGCGKCYAKTFADRFRGVAGHPYEQGFTPRLVPEALAAPFTWPRPHLVFVNSMSDLFLDAFPVEYLRRVVRAMALTPWHTYQVLTKRHERMAELLAGDLRAAADLPNVWWGVSVEDRRYGLPRIDTLRRTPARVRFLSVEPLLEDLGEVDLTGIDWVIVGGESDRRPRPFDPAWAVRLRDRCAAAGVPFFFKQHGGRNKKKAGRVLDGRTHDAMPPRSVVPIPPRSTRLQLRQAFEAEFVPVPLLTLGVRPPQPAAPGGVG
jgi:protein gp37